MPDEIDNLISEATIASWRAELYSVIVKLEDPGAAAGRPANRDNGAINATDFIT
jgi:hypothetical protein